MAPQQKQSVWVRGTVLLPLLLALGCGSSGTITGKVTYQDKAVPGGTVTFLDEKGHPFRGDIQPDGSYTITKVPKGKVKVTVETASVRPAQANMPRGMKMPRPPQDAPMGDNPGAAMYKEADASRYVKIPEDYANADKSGLELQVTGGQQEYNIPLK